MTKTACNGASWKTFAPRLVPDPHPTFPVDATNRVKRLHDLGAYEKETAHKLLDAAALAHVAVVIDGQPWCTKTLFWRQGLTLYWHGSGASRMLRNPSKAQPVCLPVTHSVAPAVRCVDTTNRLVSAKAVPWISLSFVWPG